MHKQCGGFTLTEILITLVVMAVLAGLAIPNFRNTIEQGRSNEARANLNLIHMGQKVYRLNNGAFCCAAATNTIALVNTNLGLDLAAADYPTVTVTRNAGVSYTARLTKVGGGGKWYQYDFTNGNAAPVLTEGGAF